MSVILLIALGIPLISLAGTIVGAVVGFVISLIFHGVRGFLRHFVAAPLRKMFAKKGTA